MENEIIRNVDISFMKSLPMIDFIGNDFAIFDDIREMPLAPYPTRLHAACFTVCLKGRCKMNINLVEYELSESMISIVLPDQIVERGSISDDFSGLFITISKEFIDRVLPAIQQLFPFLLLIHSPAVFPLTSFTTVDRCLEVRHILPA